MTVARHRSETARTGSRGGGAADAAPAERRWQPVRSIRARLTTIVAVPTAALVVLSAVGVAVQASTYRAAGRTLSGVHLVLAAEDLGHELQRERGLTNGLLSGRSATARSSTGNASVPTTRGAASTGR